MSGSVNNRLDGLHHLASQLKLHKPSLPELVQECKANSADSLVVRLVCELVQFCHSPDSAMAQEAAKCLGQIGPCDLWVTAMPEQPKNPALQEALGCFKDKPHLQKYCHIFHLLSDYLVDQRWETPIL